MKKVIIIGAGISGLSAGIYLQNSGFKTEIYEMASAPGGVNVSWKRKGYIFDGATNWLSGSSPSVEFHRYLREIFDFNKLEIIDFEVFARIVDTEGNEFSVYKNIDKLEEEMNRISPEDKREIARFSRVVRRLSKFRLPVSKPFKHFNLIDWIKLLKQLPLLLLIKKYRKYSIKEYVKRFKSEKLRNFIKLILPQHSGFSMVSMFMPLNWMNLGSTGYPVGGSAALVDMLVKKYRNSGGKIHFSSRVRKIVIKNNAAEGIITIGGEKVYADIVVSAADGYDTFFNMLGTEYVDNKVKRYYEKLAVYPAIIQISFGVKRSFKREANKVILQLKEPLETGGARDMNSMLIRICSFDPGFAPEGCTAVVVNLRTHDYVYWNELRKRNPDAYKKEKDLITEQVLDILEERYKGFRSQVEVTDTATPATYIRYANIWKGSYQGWLPGPEVVGQSMKKTVRGLKNFYMCGQWVDPPGGIPRVIISARQAVQLICADNKRKFQKS
jgi:phytoene dehydrogenase-like protein